MKSLISLSRLSDTGHGKIYEKSSTVLKSTSDEGTGILNHVKNEPGAHHSPDVFHVQNEIAEETMAKILICLPGMQRIWYKNSAGAGTLLMQLGPWGGSAARVVGYLLVHG